MRRDREVKIGSVFGVEIALDYSWFWIFGLITFIFAAFLLPSFDPNRTLLAYIILALLGSVLFFGSVLIHELSHTLVARRNNLPVKKITLFLFGGVSNLEEEPANPKTELKVALAGPVASLVIAFVFLAFGFLYQLFFPIELSIQMVQYIGFINILLAVFNLLPGFPLDGGRVLRALLWIKNKSFLVSTRKATEVGKYVAYFLIAYGLFQTFVGGFLNGIWLALIGFFLYSAAKNSYLQTLSVEVLKEVEVKDIMSEGFIELDGEKSLDDLEGEALKKHRNYFLIKEGKNITGILSTKSLNKYPKEKWNTKLKEIKVDLSRLPETTKEEKASDLLRKFTETRASALPVYDRKKVIGIISLKDLQDYIFIKASEYKA